MQKRYFPFGTVFVDFFFGVGRIEVLEISLKKEMNQFTGLNKNLEESPESVELGGVEFINKKHMGSVDFYRLIQSWVEKNLEIAETELFDKSAIAFMFTYQNRSEVLTKSGYTVSEAQLASLYVSSLLKQSGQAEIELER